MVLAVPSTGSWAHWWAAPTGDQHVMAEGRPELATTTYFCWCFHCYYLIKCLLLLFTLLSSNLVFLYLPLQLIATAHICCCCPALPLPLVLSLQRFYHFPTLTATATATASSAGAVNQSFN